MTLAIVLARKVDDRKATIASLALLIPGVGLLLWAQISSSMPLVVLATIVGGIAGGLGFRGTLQVVNEIAPEERRAEVISAYYIVVFEGNAAPAIGVGIVTDLQFDGR
jgi:MFS family permease